MPAILSLPALLPSLLLLALPSELALLCTDSERGVTELRLQRAGDERLAPPVATLQHAPRSGITGDLLPGTRAVLVTAALEQVRDQSFASWLVSLEPGRPARRLADGLAVATRPLVTPGGRVFVSRGRAGTAPPPTGGERLDALRVDEIDPRTGEARTLLEANGLQLLLIGVLGPELLVFELGAGGARVLALHPDSGTVRSVANPAPLLARDFVVDERAGRLLYTTSEPGARGWFIDALDLRTGTARRLVEGPSMALLPTLFPDGRVGYAPKAGGGLREVGSGELLLPPQGPGFERLRFFPGDYAVGLHEVPGRRPELLVMERLRGIRPAVERIPVTTPQGVRVELAGLLP